MHERLYTLWPLVRLVYSNWNYAFRSSKILYFWWRWWRVLHKCPWCADLNCFCAQGLSALVFDAQLHWPWLLEHHVKRSLCRSEHQSWAKIIDSSIHQSWSCCLFFWIVESFQWKCSKTHECLERAKELKRLVNSFALPRRCIFWFSVASI